MQIDAVPIDHISGPDDVFRCEPYQCKLKAGDCKRRQENAIERRQKGLVICFDCPDGRRVAEKIGGLDLPDPNDDRPRFNWAFQGFRRPKRDALVLASAKEIAMKKKCTEPGCGRWLRPGKITNPVPQGMEGLCSECRKKKLRGRAPHAPAPAPPAVRPTPRPVPPPSRPAIAPPPPVASATLVVPRAASSPPKATMAALLPGVEVSLEELIDALEIVNSVGWERARELWNIFQAVRHRSAVKQAG